jgi:membrane-bound lytic murein transglycosylase D
MYVYEYKKEHGIVPKKASTTYFETDTVMVKKQMSFKQIADLLDMPEEQLRFLNPIYKRNVVPFVTDKAHFIRLPKNKLAIFTSNEDKVYAYIDYEESKREKQEFKVKKPRIFSRDSIQTAVASSDNNQNSAEEEEVVTKSVKKLKTKYYTVKRGDNLSEISDKNNVSIAELKKWNKIKGTSVNAGQKLKIQYETSVVVADKATRKKKIDTLKVSEPVVKTSEPKTEVAVNEKTYVVQKGENLTQIAAKNNITIAQLKEWNNLEEEAIKAGQELRIQAAEEAVATNDKQDKKESKKSSIKARSFEKEHMYVVQKGDSLISISKKQGTTVAEIKKLNNIKGDNIQPGMKLKING